MKTLIKCHNTRVHYLQVLWFFPHACCRSPSAPADWWGSGQSTPPQSAPATEQQQQCTHTHACMHIHMHTHTHTRTQSQSITRVAHTHTHICTCFAILPTYVTTPVLFIICTDGMIFSFLDLCVCVFLLFFHPFFLFFPLRLGYFSLPLWLPQQKTGLSCSCKPSQQKTAQACRCELSQQNTGQSCGCKLSQ